MLLTLPQPPLGRRIFGALILLIAVLAEAQWLGYFRVLQEDNGQVLPALARIAVGGCVLFAPACLLSLFNFRAAVILGALAACLSWPHFGLLAASIPWRDLGWVLKSGGGGWAPAVIAVLGLLPATIWSLSQLHAVVRPQPADTGDRSA